MNLPFHKSAAIKGMTIDEQDVAVLFTAPDRNEVDRLRIMVIDEAGQRKWTKSWPETKFQSNKLALTFDNTNNLFVGFSFVDRFSISGQAFIPEGGSDIALLKFSETAELLQGQQFGTRHEENIHEMLYDDGILYFGGEFNGMEAKRSIGNYDFYNFKEAKQRAYISYVFDTTATDLATINKISSLSKLNIQEENYSRSYYALSPNPFSDKIDLEIHAEQAETATIYIYDGLGTLIKQTEVELTTGSNLKTVTTEDLAPGVYFIEIRNMNRTYAGDRKLVKFK